MEAHARAGIDIVGRSLRYAEVEQYGSRYRLLRLGSCEFDFELVDAVLTSPVDEHVAMVVDALRDVFSASIAGSIHVTLHPPTCYSFFAPLPSRSSSSQRKVRLQQEAALLAGTEHPLHITADAVRSETTKDGGTIDWVHVLAVEDVMHERIQRVLADLPQPRKRVMASMHAASLMIANVERSDGGRVLTIGRYPNHIEYALLLGGEWRFSRYTEAVEPVDVAYFAAHIAHRFGLEPSEIETIYLYGNHADPAHYSDLESVFGTAVSRMNPLDALDVESGGFSTDFDVEEYVGCIGAAL